MRLATRIFALAILALATAAGALAQLSVDGRIMAYSEEAPYTWVRLSVDNPGSEALGYAIRITDNYRSSTFEIKGQKIEAGAHRVHNIPVLMAQAFEIRVNDSSGHVENDYLSSDPELFVNICEIGGWASQQSLENFTKTVASAVGLHHLASSSSVDPVVEQIEPVNLPTDWRCYSSLAGIFVSDYALRRMDPAARQALMEWVRLGGGLTVYGAGRIDETNEMLGTVTYAEQNPVVSGVNDRSWSRQPLWRKYYGGSSEYKRYPYRVESSGGRMGGLALATLFCILAGPLNLMWCKRRKNIRLILLTMPALSIGFCLLIGAFFVLSQGFQRRGGTVSMTVLDESAGAAVTYGFHSLNSGIYPLGGFKFAPQTGFYPLGRHDNDEFEIDMTDGMTLKNGLFQPSINFDYFTAAPRQTREKMILDLAKGEAANGFETEIAAFAVVADGVLWKSQGPIAPGGRGELTRSNGPTKVKSAKTLLDAISGDLTDDERSFIQDQVFTQTPEVDKETEPVYLAVLEGAPEAAEPGVSINAGKEIHLLLGFAATDAEQSQTESQP